MNALSSFIPKDISYAHACMLMEPMDGKFFEHHSRLCHSLDAEGVNPKLSREYRVWVNAWRLGEDLDTVPKEERLELIHNSFASDHQELALLCMINGTSYEVSEAWLTFSKAIELAMQGKAKKSKSKD